MFQKILYRAVINMAVILSVCPGLIFFLYFHFSCLNCCVIEGMDESFLLSKVEPLTPNIDGVMAL